MIAELERVRQWSQAAFEVGAPLERVLEEIRLAAVEVGLAEAARVLGGCITNGCEAHELTTCRYCRMHITPEGGPARL